MRVVSRLRRAACLLATAALCACSPKPLPANPALWRVDGPHGERAWLFGTIHALPRPVDWRTPKVEEALGKADLLVVEIAALNNDRVTARAFQSLAHTPGQPPLADKLPPRLRPALTRLLARGGLKPQSFADTETWAAALTLAQISESADDTGNGVDRALLRLDPFRPVAELEGAHRQISLFDALPEASQRELLAEVVEGADSADADTHRLADAWRRGDMTQIESDTHRGMLADPALRDTLYVKRNQAWTQAILSEMARGAHPFVAVGAAHMAGAEGLPALLAQKGYKVTRVE